MTASEIVRARELPDRLEVVALADRVAVEALRARGRDDASEATWLAAALRERLFRGLHSETDGREAGALLERTAEGGRKACDAWMKRAALLGELARDPVVTLREIEGMPVHLRERGCVARAESAWESLGAFRGRAGVSERAPSVVAAAGGAGQFGASASASSAWGEVAPSASVVGAVSEVVGDVVASPDGATVSKEALAIRTVEAFGERESARVVVHLSGVTTFSLGAAPPVGAGKGPRVYVDLARTRVGKVRREQVVGGLVERVRVGAHGGGARVVLDLSKAAMKRVFFLPDPFRVVIDVTTQLGGASKAARGRREVARVVLDPGHGGHDPGAAGPSGLREKDVTLDVAHRAAPVLARELGVSTLLTRDGDDYVSLEARTARANAFGADLFVSIHCNASESSAARGIQTFVLDTSSDEVAMRVAARENNASSAQAGPEVARLLRELRLADVGARSTRFAGLLQRAAIASMEGVPGVVDQGVKTAGFYVLVGAQMPAVLFETSFVSNPVEEQRLGTAEYRQRLADSIVNAVRAYRDGL